MAGSPCGSSASGRSLAEVAAEVPHRRGRAMACRHRQAYTAAVSVLAHARIALALRQHMRREERVLAEDLRQTGPALECSYRCTFKHVSAHVNIGDAPPIQ